MIVPVSGEVSIVVLKSKTEVVSDFKVVCGNVTVDVSGATDVIVDNGTVTGGNKVLRDDNEVLVVGNEVLNVDKVVSTLRVVREVDSSVVEIRRVLPVEVLVIQNGTVDVSVLISLVFGNVVVVVILLVGKVVFSETTFSIFIHLLQE